MEWRNDLHGLFIHLLQEIRNACLVLNPLSCLWGGEQQSEARPRIECNPVSARPTRHVRLDGFLAIRPIQDGLLQTERVHGPGLQKERVVINDLRRNVCTIADFRRNGL